MIKVLLVDNNQKSLAYFKKLVDFNKLGFEIVAAAIDGKKAYTDFLYYKPEVIISDIDLPCMTGIELASRVKQIEPDTIIIFLSSYEEFKYVRSALNLRVYDYILKREATKERIIERLLSIQKMIEKQQEKNRVYYKSSLYAIMEDYEDNMGNISSRAYHEIFPHKYHLFVVEQVHILSFIAEELQNHSHEQPEFEIKSISYGICKNIKAVVKVAPYRYVYLVKSNEKKVSDYAFDLQKKLENDFSCNYSLIVLAESLHINECLHRYYSNISIINTIIFHVTSVILYYQDTIDYVHRTVNIDMKVIEKCIVNHNYDTLVSVIDYTYNQIVYNKDYEQFITLSILLFRFLLPYHHKIIDYQNNTLFYAYDDDSTTFWQEAISFIPWIKNKIKLLVNVLQNNQICNYSLQVEKVLQYINQNYADANLSAQMIAEKVNMNINHLNTIFKKETGDTVWKRLIKVRMQKAKRLLDNSGYKIGDVYMQVGFNSLSYFSTVFKKNYGYSPKEYKKNK